MSAHPERKSYKCDPLQSHRSHTAEHGILLLPFEGFRCFSLLLPLSFSLLLLGAKPVKCTRRIPSLADRLGPPAARPEEESQYRGHVSRDKPQGGQIQDFELGCVTRSMLLAQNEFRTPCTTHGTTPDKKSASDATVRLIITK